MNKQTFHIRFLTFAYCILLTLLFRCAPTSAHPHVFIDCHLRPVFDERGLAGFKQRWVFDDMFTAFLFENFDADFDRAFSSEEIQAIKRGAFDPLDEHGYFTHIRIDGTTFPVLDVTSFSVELAEEGKAIYQFFVPCPVPFDNAPREILASVFDSTYYTDITLLPPGEAEPQTDEFTAVIRRENIPEYAYYSQQIIPEGLHITPIEETLYSPTKADIVKDDTPSSENVSNRFQQLFATLSSWQKRLKNQLSRFGKEIQEQPYGQSFWLFLLLSCVYGILHALGPGHGKTIVVSYFLSHPGRYLHGVLMGNLITFVHVFSAVIIVLLVRFVLTRAEFTAASSTLASVSYSLLILLGLTLLGKSLYDITFGTHGLSEEPIAVPKSLRSLLFTSFVTGLVPCPGAALILFFAISHQILAAGLLAMLCVANGMGITTTFFACSAIASRKVLFRLTARRRKLLTLTHAALSLIGAVIIISTGTLLLLGN